MPANPVAENQRNECLSLDRQPAEPDVERQPGKYVTAGHFPQQFEVFGIEIDVHILWRKLAIAGEAAAAVHAIGEQPKSRELVEQEHAKLFFDRLLPS